MPFHPFIATPAYGGMVTVAYVSGLQETTLALSQNKLTYSLALLSGESLIERARNECVARFLERSEATHLFFIDADIGWRAEDFMSLLHSSLDFVLAPYKRKDGSGEWTVCLERKEMHEAVEDSRRKRFVSCQSGGAGFLCLSRAAVVRLWMDEKESYQGGTKGAPIECRRIFRPRIHAGKLVGEDTDLCLRWRERGEIVYCAIDTELGHWGLTEHAGTLGPTFSRFGNNGNREA